MTIWYGGDYNPEQWPTGGVGRGRARSCSAAASRSPRWACSPGRASSRARASTTSAGSTTCSTRSTPTGCASTWPPRRRRRRRGSRTRHPETLPVTEDGVRLSVGSRQQYCPSSPVYRERARQLVGDWWSATPTIRPSSCGTSTTSTAATSATATATCPPTAFRDVARARYGTIDELNRGLGHGVLVAALRLVRRGASRRARRRRSATRRSCSTSTGSPATSCWPATGRRSTIDPRGAPTCRSPPTSWASSRPSTTGRGRSEVDVVSDDTYPDPADPISPPYAAMVRDLMRSLGDGAAVAAHGAVARAR